MAAGGEHHRIRLENRPVPRHEVETIRAEAHPIGDEQTRDVLIFDHRNAELLRSVRQGVEDGATRVVAGVAGPPVFVRPEETLIQPAIVESCELAAPIGELAYRVRRLPGHDLDHAWMAEEVALPKRVGEVLFPRVLGIACPEHRIDAARGQNSVRIESMPLTHDQHLASRLGRGDRRAQSGGARTDDQDVADPAAGRWCRHDYAFDSDR